MIFSELHKIMMNKVSFVSFRGGDRHNRPPGSAPDFDSQAHCSHLGYTNNGFFKLLEAFLPIHSCFFSHRIKVGDLPLLAVTVWLLYLPRCLRSTITCNKTPTSATTSDLLKISCHVIVTQ